MTSSSPPPYRPPRQLEILWNLLNTEQNSWTVWYIIGQVYATRRHMMLSVPQRVCLLSQTMTTIPDDIWHCVGSFLVQLRPMAETSGRFRNLFLFCRVHLSSVKVSSTRLLTIAPRVERLSLAQVLVKHSTSFCTWEYDWRITRDVFSDPTFSYCYAIERWLLSLREVFIGPAYS